MAEIEFAFHTDDESIKALCQKYWARGPDGKFRHNVSVVADALHLSTHEVASFVRQYCTVYAPAESCCNCQDWQPFNSRAELLTRRGSRNAWVCARCQETKRLERERETNASVQ